MSLNSILHIIQQYFLDLTQSAYSQSGHWHSQSEDVQFFISKEYSNIQLSYYDGKIFIADKENIHFHSTKCQGRHDIDFTFKGESFNIVVFESYLEEKHKKWNEDPFENKPGLYAYIVNDTLSADDIPCEENLYFSHETKTLLTQINLFLKDNIDTVNSEFKARLFITPEFAIQYEKEHIGNKISSLTRDNTLQRL